MQANEASLGPCFDQDLWTSPRTVRAIAFSDRPFFSQPLYHYGSIQRSAGP
jgi:hypothetical protein